MGEKFTVVLKDGSRIMVKYPKDARNPFKLRKFYKAKRGNVVAVEGSGPVAQRLRKQYGLSDELEVSNMDVLKEVTGLSERNIRKKLATLKRRVT
jgi:hypothetical protein